MVGAELKSSFRPTLQLMNVIRERGAAPRKSILYLASEAGIGRV